MSSCVVSVSKTTRKKGLGRRGTIGLLRDGGQEYRYVFMTIWKGREDTLYRCGMRDQRKETK